MKSRNEMDDTLFPLPPAGEPDPAPEKGKPRLKRVNREQIIMQTLDLESSLPSDHPARLVWDLVEGLDLSPLYAQIQAVEGHAGQSAIDPAILMALWLFATLQGIGSARVLDSLCREHDAYRWLCGGVSVNYHTLSDFRVDHSAFLEDLLTGSVAALICDGLVTMQRVTQDGKRVRASAGSNSFHRRKTLEKCLQEARQQVDTLRKELEDDPGATTRRQTAARERARRERLERVEKARQRMEQLEAKQAKRNKKENQAQRRREPRASTTDAEATLMKMADGGYRPAFNVQFSTDTASKLIVGVEVSNQGNDSGLMGPMRQHIEQDYGQAPDEYLVDGGFVHLQDIEEAEKHQTLVYAPVPTPRRESQDPYAPRRSDSPEIAAWRQRMATDAAKTIYKERAAVAEWVNAIQHNRGLVAFRVRGRDKVKAVVLWFALLHNLLRGFVLRQLAVTALAN
jgi:transposase